MSIGTKLHTLFSGTCVGEDMFGNRYYQARKVAKSGARKRWVMYNGLAEPSKVPPLWHAWLHYMVEDVPDALGIPHYEWQKDHKPNLTGTPNAYLPPGHLSKVGERDASVSDYDAWNPALLTDGRS